MAEKGTASKVKQDQKMVPLAELSNYRVKSREREQELKAQIQDLETRLSRTEDELRVATADVEDDEKLKNVRTYLVDREKKVSKLEADYAKKVASLESREQEATIKELVFEFRAKGVDVDTETLRDEENPRLKCWELYAEHLESEREAGKGEGGEEGEGEQKAEVFETGVHGIIKKQPKDMSDEEFEQYEKDIKSAAYAKK